MTRLLPRRPALAVGLAVTAVMVAMALLSLVWTPQPPAKMHILQRLRPPLAQGLLGTDPFGRDVLSLLMAGAWNSLSTAVIAVAIGASAGTLIGLGVAARRGRVESVAMRLCDLVFALPPILSAMLLAAFIGTGRFTAIAAIAIFMVPVFARLVRAAALQVWARDYVTAAIGMGCGPARITMAHVLPNISHLITVQVTIQLGLAILTEAGLSFLGLGLPPPTPSWGRMLFEAQSYFAMAPWLAIFPGLAIASTVLGLNLLGDGLRDLLDPRDR